MNVFIAQVEGSTACLTAEESWHCCRVLRMKVGEQIKLINGKGLFFEAVLIQVNDKQCKAEILAKPVEQLKRNYQLHLAIAPTKQIDRIEWMIEKAVEIGIDEISFIQCKNSERTVIKIERVLKIVESAVKQSLQAFIPKVNAFIQFKEFVVHQQQEQQNYIAHCFSSSKLELKKIEFKNQSTLVVIGPEGDFTEAEVAFANELGYRAISLGENRLRTETAGLVVCQAASLLS